MDQITTDVRMAEWTSVIQQCQNRPNGQTAKQWLEENGVSSKKYYYWFRKVRKQFYNDTVESLPDRHSVATTGLAYVELPADEHVSNAAKITRGRRGDRIKALLWEGTGFLLLYKRFENGTLSWPFTPQEAVAISKHEYRLLLQGLNPVKPKVRASSATTAF